MAVYDNVPDIKKAPKPKKKVTSKRQRSQMPGHPTDEPRGLSESGTKNSAKVTKPVAKAVSKPLDSGNKAAKVAGKGSARDSIAPGARKAGAPTPKPSGTDKKVRGQAKK